MRKALKTLLFISILMITDLAIAQSDATQQLAEKRLLEVYSQEYIDGRKESNPALYEYLMSTAVYKPMILQGKELKYDTQNSNETKITRGKEQITLDMFYNELQSDDFNLLNYSVKPANNSLVFKISEETYVIIESQKEVLLKYKKR